MTENFKLRNNKVNIQYLYEEVLPIDRSDAKQNAKFKSFIFSFLLSNIYTNKCIHDFRNRQVKNNVITLLGISERNYYRLFNEALNNGYIFFDRDNDSNLRIKSYNKLINEINVPRREAMVEGYSGNYEFNHRSFGTIPHWRKATLKLRNLNFKDAEDVFNASLIRFAIHIARRRASVNRKRNVHKGNRMSQGRDPDKILLEFQELDKKTVFSHYLEVMLSTIRKELTGESRDLNTMIFNKNNSVDIYTGRTYNGIPMLAKQLSNGRINKIKDSAIISMYDYFLVNRINGLRDEDLGSRNLGKALGYTKSGINSKLDDLEKKGHLVRHQRYVFLGACSYEEYGRIKRSLLKIIDWEDHEILNNLYNRIVYKHGCMLMQRENMIVVKSPKIEFDWYWKGDMNFVLEMPQLKVLGRYKTLSDKLNIKPCLVENKINDYKLVLNYDKVVRLEDNKIFHTKNDLFKAGIKYDGQTSFLLSLESGYKFENNTYKFLDTYKELQAITCKQYELEDYDRE